MSTWYLNTLLKTNLAGGLVQVLCWQLRAQLPQQHSLCSQLEYWHWFLPCGGAHDLSEVGICNHPLSPCAGAWS